MLSLPRKSFNKIKSLLQHQEKKVEENLKTIDADDPVMNAGLAESSEPGTDSWMADVHTRALAARQNLKDMLSKIRHALSKIKSGSYGKCENCGKNIELDRLKAIPTATLCVACSKKVSK